MEWADDLWGTGNGANLGPSPQTITMPESGGGANGFEVLVFSPYANRPTCKNLHCT
jgi:hypothetical protein